MLPQDPSVTDELLDRYEQGALSPAELAAFEERLLTDPGLARRLRHHRETLDALRHVGQRRQLRAQLQAIQNRMDEQDSTPASNTGPIDRLPAPAEAPPLAPSRPAPVMRTTWVNPLRSFWQAHRATMGVAASVAILAAFGTLYLTSVWKSYQRQSAYGYAVLRREVERIKRTQNAIMRDINAVDSSATDADQPDPDGGRLASFSGTGFALSANGYLVTSWHVVKDADSLLVEGGPQHRRYSATTVYRDEARDLAILRITDRRFKTLGRLPYTFKKTDADLGERVYTLGYPREDVVYGEGALASRSGYEGDSSFYQVSVPVNPGNSGGPLLDDRGNLIGIISGRQLDVQSAAFAVKSTALLQLLANLPANDTATVKPELPRGNQLTGSRRPEQLRRLQDFVFVVKVYN